MAPATLERSTSSRKNYLGPFDIALDLVVYTHRYREVGQAMISLLSSRENARHTRMHDWWPPTRKVATFGGQNVTRYEHVRNRTDVVDSLEEGCHDGRVTWRCVVQFILNSDDGPATAPVHVVGEGAELFFRCFFVEKKTPWKQSTGTLFWPSFPDHIV